MKFGKKLQKIFKKGIFLLVAAGGTIKAGLAAEYFELAEIHAKAGVIIADYEFGMEYMNRCMALYMAWQDVDSIYEMSTPKT